MAIEKANDMKNISLKKKPPSNRTSDRGNGGYRMWILFEPGVFRNKTNKMYPNAGQKSNFSYPLLTKGFVPLISAIAF